MWWVAQPVKNDIGLYNIYIIATYVVAKVQKRYQMVKDMHPDVPNSVQ